MIFANPIVKAYVAWGIKLCVSIAVIWLILDKVDLATTWQRARRVDLWLAAAATLMLIAQIVAAAARWHCITRAIGGTIDFGRSLRIFYSSLVFNQIFPASLGGDAVRVLKLRQAGQPVAKAINGVLLERIVALAGLVLLIAFLFPLVQSRVQNDAFTVALVLSALATGAAIALTMNLDRLPAAVRTLKPVAPLVTLALDARRLFSNPRAIGIALALAILGHVQISLAVYLLALGLGIAVSVADCLALVPAVIFIMLLPISVAGWGVREGAMVVAFGLVGVSAEAAFALSVLFGLIVVAIALPGALSWMAAERVSARAAPPVTDLRH